jgi:hypothetical protein
MENLNYYFRIGFKVKYYFLEKIIKIKPNFIRINILTTTKF